MRRMDIVDTPLCCDACDLQGFFGADCGNEAARLAFDMPLQRVDAAFEYDFFQLPDLNPSALTHSIEVARTRVTCISSLPTSHL